MKTVEQLLHAGHTQLLEVTTDVDQAWLEAELLLGQVLGQDRVWLAIHRDQTLTDSQHEAFQQLLARRTTHEPMAYILGEASFYGRSFHVTKDTLIPRFETERIIDEIRSTIMTDTRKTAFWDVGTGSGILAITLKSLYPQMTVVGSDISAAALEIARENAKALPLEHPIFLEGSLLEEKLLTHLAQLPCEQFVIVANLPYLPESDKQILDRQVTAFEPSLALFVSDEGLSLNKKLIEQVAQFAKKDGRPVTLLLEFDPPQATTLETFAKAFFAETRIIKDHCDRERFLVLR